MFYDEHNPPHFHAEYQRNKAVFFDLVWKYDQGKLKIKNGNQAGQRVD